MEMIAACGTRIVGTQIVKESVVGTMTATSLQTRCVAFAKAELSCLHLNALTQITELSTQEETIAYITWLLMAFVVSMMTAISLQARCAVVAKAAARTQMTEQSTQEETIVIGTGIIVPGVVSTMMMTLTQV